MVVQAWHRDEAPDGTAGVRFRIVTNDELICGKNHPVWGFDSVGHQVEISTGRRFCPGDPRDEVGAGQRQARFRRFSPTCCEAAEESSSSSSSSSSCSICEFPIALVDESSSAASLGNREYVVCEWDLTDGWHLRRVFCNQSRFSTDESDLWWARDQDMAQRNQIEETGECETVECNPRVLCCPESSSSQSSSSCVLLPNHAGVELRVYIVFLDPWDDGCESSSSSSSCVQSCGDELQAYEATLRFDNLGHLEEILLNALLSFPCAVPISLGCCQEGQFPANVLLEIFYGVSSANEKYACTTLTWNGCKWTGVLTSECDLDTDGELEYYDNIIELGCVDSSPNDFLTMCINGESFAIVSTACCPLSLSTTGCGNFVLCGDSATPGADCKAPAAICDMNLTEPPCGGADCDEIARCLESSSTPIGCTEEPCFWRWMPGNFWENTDNPCGVGCACAEPDTPGTFLFEERMTLCEEIL